MNYLYYPGCSQKAASICYERSLLEVARKLGIDFMELDDWTCCGATIIISLNKILSLTLAARNLALAERFGLTLITPCPNCWISLTRVNRVFQENGIVKAAIQKALAEGGLSYNGTTMVRHILEFFVNEIGLEKIKEKIVSPLRGLKVAPYYGCQIVRPYAEGDDAANPQNLEKLITTLGAQVTDFALRTSCCGGALMITQKKQAEKMSLQILKDIAGSRADIVVTSCGLCQMNLELTAQKLKKVIPILNITQLMALAFGVEIGKLGVFLPRKYRKNRENEVFLSFCR